MLARSVFVSTHLSAGGRQASRTGRMQVKDEEKRKTDRPVRPIGRVLSRKTPVRAGWGPEERCRDTLGGEAWEQMRKGVGLVVEQLQPGKPRNVEPREVCGLRPRRRRSRVVNSSKKRREKWPPETCCPAGILVWNRRPVTSTPAAGRMDRGGRGLDLRCLDSRSQQRQEEAGAGRRSEVTANSYLT